MQIFKINKIIAITV